MDEQAVIVLFVFKWSQCKMETIRACQSYLGPAAEKNIWKLYLLTLSFIFFAFSKIPGNPELH